MRSPFLLQNLRSQSDNLRLITFIIKAGRVPPIADRTSLPVNFITSGWLLSLKTGALLRAIQQAINRMFQNGFFG
jgi:hypothetical protein